MIQVVSVILAGYEVIYIE